MPPVIRYTFILSTIKKEKNVQDEDLMENRHLKLVHLREKSSSSEEMG